MSHDRTRLGDHERSEGARHVAIIGAGPRGTGLVERLVENHPSFGAEPIVVHLIDPFPPGAGRIWRDEQSSLLCLNSLAADVTMLTDDSATIDGPIAAGPSLVEWAREVRAGAISAEIDPEAEPKLAVELDALGPGSFPTRRLQQRYLAWCLQRAASRLASGSRLQYHPTRAVAVRDAPETGAQRVELESGEHLTVDVVVYALGHTSSRPSSATSRTAAFADIHRLSYVPPSYTADANLDALRPGETVLVRGMGLAAIDLLVLLAQGRGGTFVATPERGPGSLRYLPSGREPRLLMGSRRGVPYHAKPTAALVGAPPAGRYVTRQRLANLLEGPQRVDARDDVLPLLRRELVHGVCRELFTGHPERTRGSWDELLAVLDGHESESPEVAAALERAFPDPRDRFDMVRLDRPLQWLSSAHGVGRCAPGNDVDASGELQAVVRDYIRDDVDRRTASEHSASTALFLSLLNAHLAIVDVSDHPNWTARSVAELERWHAFFSFIASGPPGPRLEELLALAEAGVVAFLGGGLRVELDETAGEFVARGDHTPPGGVRARALVDAWLPGADVASTLDPALQDLIASGAGREWVRDDGEERVSTGRLEVRRSDSRIVEADGQAHPRRFAIGPFTSAPFVGAFARPRTNAVAFRENDAVARGVLDILAALPAAEARARSRCRPLVSSAR